MMPAVGRHVVDGNWIAGCHKTKNVERIEAESWEILANISVILKEALS
jgi:hypothetical protein